MKNEFNAKRENSLCRTAILIEAAWLAVVLAFLAASCNVWGSYDNPADSKGNGARAISGFSFLNPAVNGIINENAKTITLTVPYGTNVAALVAVFSATGSSVKVNGTVQASGSTPNNFTNPNIYEVTAINGTKAAYTVTVVVAASSAKAISSFAFANPAVTGTINESAKTIAVTVPYGTDVTSLKAAFVTTGLNVKVGSTIQASGATSNDFTAAVAYTVTAADGSTASYSVMVTIAPNSAKAITAFSFASLSVDAVINEAAKTIAATVPNGTNVSTLVATFAATGASVKIGSTTQVSGTTPNNFTAALSYTVTAADGSSVSYTVAVTVAPSGAKEINAFSFANYEASGSISESAKTITITVPFGTNVAALTAIFTTTGASVRVGSTVQASGTTVNNFTAPVAYTVSAANGTTAVYTVTVTVAPSSAKAITAFSFASLAVNGGIDESAKTITIPVPFGTDVTALAASFITNGSSVIVGTTIQFSGSTSNDFTGPVAYTVTAADGSASTYTVTVTITPIVPNLTTAAISGITATQATGGGTVTNDGGAAVSARGLCWSAATNPTTADAKTMDGSGTGGFVSAITGLTPGTVYYVRAYAINSAGTGYGSQTSFTTIPAAPAAPSVFAVGYMTGSGQVSVSWASVPGATAYDVYFSATEVPPGAANGPTDVAGLFCTLSDLINYSTYNVWILAKNAAGASPLGIMGSGAPGIHVSGVSLDKTAHTLVTTATVNLTATVAPANATNQSIAWSSDTASVAIVSSSGLVTAVAPGTAIITVTTSDQGKAATCGITVDRIITTIAGTGTSGYSGDGGNATAAKIYQPEGIAVDSSGNIFIADVGNYRIRKVSTSGIITTVAGNGINGFSGDGGPATLAKIYGAVSVAVDSVGNLYIAEYTGARIRKVDTNGIITTVAGGNGGGFTGDGGPATSAQLFSPSDMAVDSTGNIYIADYDRIRKVSNGIITRVAGGESGGDGIAATSAHLHYASGVDVDSSGNIYIADGNDNRIRKVDTNGIITTVAGNGTQGFSGDGGPATQAAFRTPLDLAVDASGNIYIADTYNHRIRKVDTNGIITTVVGNGTQGFLGDGGAATQAELHEPYCISVDSSGTLYIGDLINQRVRKVY